MKRNFEVILYITISVIFFIYYHTYNWYGRTFYANIEDINYELKFTEIEDDSKLHLIFYDTKNRNILPKEFTSSTSDYVEFDIKKNHEIVLKERTFGSGQKGESEDESNQNLCKVGIIHDVERTNYYRIIIQPDNARNNVYNVDTIIIPKQL